MRRLRNVVAAVLILIALVYVIAQHQSVSEWQLRFQTPIVLSKSDSGNATVGQQDETPDQSAPSDITSLSQLESPPDIAPIDKSLTDIPISQSTTELPPSPLELPQASATEAPPTPLNTESATSEPEFSFQKDLNLDLPVPILKQFSNLRPHNYDANAPKTYTYATFLASRNPSLKDPYYMAIQSVLYRVLWSQRSRTQKYPFVVFVGEWVTAEQRELLSGAGAVVRELASVDWACDKPGVQSRWKDLFAKLHMWNETEFSRILFLDADAFPLAPIDDMFELAPIQGCNEAKLKEEDVLTDGTPVCEPYIFAGVPQDPFNKEDPNINVGSMVFTPSKAMHQRLLQNYAKTDHYDCLMAEQAFLNWQFNPNGPFPATELMREYGGFFPSDNEEGNLKVVHEKIWVEGMNSVPWLKKEWDTQWQEMLAFYNGNEFVQMRQADGITV
jgi:alpha-N-acetylglucosamine transferase